MARGIKVPVIDGKKECTYCLEHKELAEFYTYKRGTRIHTAYSKCKTCVSHYDKAYRLKNPDKTKQRVKAAYHRHKEKRKADAKRYREAHPEKSRRLTRDYRFRSLYGITLAQYDAMFADQDGKCAICNRPEVRLNKKGSPYYLSVDHDHASGEVRQLLCYTCNSLIGYLDESVDIAEAVVSYLKRWKNK